MSVLDFGDLLHGSDVRRRLWPITAEEFYALCLRNPDLFAERTSDDVMVVVGASGGEDSRRKAAIGRYLWEWTEAEGSGIAFASSAMFHLPDGADRSPDASWVTLERWNALSEDEQERFALLCPDFVIELLSPSDSLRETQTKMEEYLANGARLGWLIDRKQRKMHVYRPGQPVAELDDPARFPATRSCPASCCRCGAFFEGGPPVMTLDVTHELENGLLTLRKPGMTHEKFADFCARNPDVFVELTAEGDLLITPPRDALTDSANAEVVGQLGVWYAAVGRPGLAFGPTAGFTLPNGAVRSPDASWMSQARWDAIPEPLRAPFPAGCPEFVVEVMSPSDRLTAAQAKMEEYLANGALLGLLIDRQGRRVFVYRPGVAAQEMPDPARVSADPEVPGFVLEMQHVF